jgi:hypothetical protein
MWEVKGGRTFEVGDELRVIRLAGVGVDGTRRQEGLADLERPLVHHYEEAKESTPRIKGS